MSEAPASAANYLRWTGIALMVFGAIAIAAPAFAGAAVMMVIGALLLLSGILQIVHGFQEQSWSNKLLPLILGILTTIAGCVVLAHPLMGMVVLALFLAVVFVMEGIWKIVVAFSFRPASGWLAMLFSGILGFLLGFLIWMQWPLSGLWAVGILIGVDLLVTGSSMLALAMTINRAKEIAEEAAPV